MVKLAERDRRLKQNYEDERKKAEDELRAREDEVLFQDCAHILV